MKYKILYVETPLNPPGGGQISLFLILRHINRAKFEPLVTSPTEGEFTEWMKKETIPYFITPLKKLFRLIKKAKPSVIHCNSPTTKYAFRSALIARLLGIPFIWHVRVAESGGWKERLIAVLASKIVVISDTVKEKFAWISSKDKVVKIHNAVDTDIFRPGLNTESLLDEFNIKRGKKIIGIFSRLDPWKGHTLFFESAGMIKDKIPNSVFLVVGEGEKEYKNLLMSQVEILGLKNDVIFAGFRNDISQLMNLCDVIVNLSVEPEAFGRTVIEAMACGKAVVATKMGGVAEVIKDNTTGILVSKTDAPGIANSCIELSKNEDRAKEMGLMGRKRAEEFFSAPMITKRIEAVYEEFVP
jgi:glycosyltransferase involved in cell wall biosynthesis